MAPKKAPRTLLAATSRWFARHSTEVALAALVLSVHAYFYNGVGANQNARLDAVYAFVDPGTPDTRSFRITRFIEGPQGTNTFDWAKAGDAYYSNKAPGSSLWPIPIYAALRAVESSFGVNPLHLRVEIANAYILTVWTSAFWTALATVVLYRFVRRERESTERDAVTIALIYAFATLAFPFDTELWGHTMAAALILLGFTELARGTDRPVAAGFFYGAAILTDYFSMAAAGAFAVLLIGNPRWQRIGWMALGALGPLAVLAVYQHALFGSFFVTASSSMANPHMSPDPTKIGGKFGAFRAEVLHAVLFSWNRGVFIGMPVLFFVPRQALRACDAPRRNLVAIACAAGAIGSLLALACYAGWHGGSSTGSRYLIPTLPFWCLLLPRPSRLARAERTAFALLSLVSAANMFVVAAVWVMSPLEQERLWLTLYSHFAAGSFPHSATYSHGLADDPEHHLASTFNLGQKLGLHGLASVVPVLILLTGGAAWLWKRAGNPRAVTAA